MAGVRWSPPQARGVIEKNTVRALVDSGTVVITVGGGGIPVVRRNGRLVGTPAVIDKDFASAKLAELLNADMLIILTAVGEGGHQLRQARPAVAQ